MLCFEKNILMSELLEVASMGAGHTFLLEFLVHSDMENNILEKMLDMQFRIYRKFQI